MHRFDDGLEGLPWLAWLGLAMPAWLGQAWPFAKTAVIISILGHVGHLLCTKQQ
jgi:hypothetical protein